MEAIWIKKTGIIAGVLVAAFAILIGVSLWQNSQGPIDYTQYDLTDVIVADENSGNFAENIDGDPNAPVKIIEYGDYQCTACAPTNPYINKLIEEYDGEGRGGISDLCDVLSSKWYGGDFGSECGGIAGLLEGV